MQGRSADQAHLDTGHNVSVEEKSEAAKTNENAKQKEGITAKDSPMMPARSSLRHPIAEGLSKLAETAEEPIMDIDPDTVPRDR